MEQRILLVDDEADILEFISYNLIREGYQVYTATNGKEGCGQSPGSSSPSDPARCDDAGDGRD